ncbi:Crp/Fnr family transcriptional regulator [Clostridium sp. BJN0001]|uniref:Crp/Fnr family transcriptional regulator n=1 Tax=Clostridium sp. BJN0001 TaxID=2930219 RepID=UPI001FD31024|nr:Crp/Fnr family transcriptional regulator [Clostridium sp. BJN0001]
MIHKEDSIAEKKKKINLLFEKYPFLKDINDKNNGLVEKNSEFRIMYSNECMLSNGRMCERMPFVLTGEINIKKINIEGEETNLYNIKAGGLCHEALNCILHYNSLNISACAICDSLMCTLSTEFVREYLLENIEFLKYMYQDIYKKLDLIIKKREEKNHKSLEKRLIEFFLKKNSKIIYITHRELALEIDSSRESVTRKLNEFEKKGLIKSQRGKITLLSDIYKL